jgi:hypothetical protein
MKAGDDLKARQAIITKIYIDNSLIESDIEAKIKFFEGHLGVASFHVYGGGETREMYLHAMESAYLFENGFDSNRGFNMTTREEVYKALDSERDYQDEKWNVVTSTSGGNHSIEDYMVYMEDYIAEIKHLLSRKSTQESYPIAIEIVRKVTAMGVHCMQQYGAPLRKRE